MLEKSIDTKTAILTIAKDLMRQLGYNAFSYADIAQQLNIKNAAIHYHYPAKEDLLLGVIDTYIEEYQHLGKQLIAAPISSLQKLSLFIEKYSVLIDQKSICIIGSVASDYNTLPKSVREKVLKLIDLVINMVAQTLADGRAKGELTFSEEPKTKSLLIMTNLAAGVQLARITGKNDFNEIVKALLDQIKK
ncbi:MAG: TetR/AcrR family transcriptional regulator [Sphingobacteriia bacterium]|jgi:AcrR family transcriptional regulator